MQCPLLLAGRRGFLEICLGRSLARAFFVSPKPLSGGAQLQAAPSVHGSQIQPLAASPGAPHTSGWLGICVAAPSRASHWEPGRAEAARGEVQGNLDSVPKYVLK